MITLQIICRYYHFSDVTAGNSTASSEQNKLIYYDAPPSSGQRILDTLDTFTDKINIKIISQLCQLNWLKYIYIYI